MHPLTANANSARETGNRTVEAGPRGMEAGEDAFDDLC